MPIIIPLVMQFRKRMHLFFYFFFNTIYSFQKRVTTERRIYLIINNYLRTIVPYKCIQVFDEVIFKSNEVFIKELNIL